MELRDKGGKVKKGTAARQIANGKVSIYRFCNP